MSKARLLLSLAVVAVTSLLLVTSCFSQGAVNSFYDAGAEDVSISSEQMSQYVLYRFETSGSGHTLTLPSAADIIDKVDSPTIGQLFIMVVAADGVNPVTVTGGTGMIIKTSATEVAGNTTQSLYFVITNTSSGTQSITVY